MLKVKIEKVHSYILINPKGHMHICAYHPRIVPDIIIRVFDRMHILFIRFMFVYVYIYIDR